MYILLLLCSMSTETLPDSILHHSVPAGPPAGADVVALKQYWGLSLTEVKR